MRALNDPSFVAERASRRAFTIPNVVPTLDVVTRDGEIFYESSNT